MSKNYLNYQYNLNFKYNLQEMSVDESQQQDCTVYIEQLKSDNAASKLAAAEKIPVIAAVLGHNRIRDQLIPYLVEIIQQMDNDNDFLIKVSEGLQELKSFCNNNKQLSILIHPLRILGSLDQPSVRDNAINCLKRLTQGANKAFHEDYYVPLIQKLSIKGNPYPPKIVAACLIPVVYPHVNEKSQDQLRRIFKQLALDQNSPLVRRALAQNVEAFKGVVSKNVVKTDLLQIWQAFITDPIDIVRIKALQCAHIVASAFKNDQTNDKFYKFIKQVDPNKKSWRIRYSVAECLANLIYKLDKQTIKRDVLECFQQLLKDSEPEVRAIALLKVPFLSQKLSKQQSYNVLFQYFQKSSKDGAKDVPPTVKLALVQSIIPYFKTIDPQKIIQNGIPILSSLVKDQNVLVRIGIITHIGDLHQVIGKEATTKYLIPMIEGVLNDKKWRFKLAVSQNIQKLFKTLGYDDFKQFFDKVINMYMKDHNYSVRQQTIKCLVNLKQIFKPETMYEIINKYITQLGSQVNYIYRCSSILLFEKVALNNIVGKKEINDIFLSFTQNLSTQNQKVPNVLIYYFDCYKKVRHQLSGASKKEYGSFLRKVQQTINDEDVKFYMQAAEQLQQ